MLTHSFIPIGPQNKTSPSHLVRFVFSLPGNHNPYIIFTLKQSDHIFPVHYYHSISYPDCRLKTPKQSTHPTLPSPTHSETSWRWSCLADPSSGPSCSSLPPLPPQPQPLSWAGASDYTSYQPNLHPLLQLLRHRRCHQYASSCSATPSTETHHMMMQSMSRLLWQRRRRRPRMMMMSTTMLKGRFLRTRGHSQSV